MGLNMNYPIQTKCSLGSKKKINPPTPKVLNVVDYVFPAEIAESFAEIR